MKLSYALQNLKLYERNREWLAAPISFTSKIAYYPAIAASYLRLGLHHSKSIRYLGSVFHYDNPATPLNLQNYPYEVGHKLLSHMTSMPSSVLDIGANLGQFSVTLAHLCPEAQIDAFEPNPAVWAILTQNANDRIRCFNYAGADGNRFRVLLRAEPVGDRFVLRGERRKRRSNREDHGPGRQRSGRSDEAPRIRPGEGRRRRLRARSAGRPQGHSNEISLHRSLGQRKTPELL